MSLLICFALITGINSLQFNATAPRLAKQDDVFAKVTLDEAVIFGQDNVKDLHVSVLVLFSLKLSIDCKKLSIFFGEHLG